MFHSTNPEKQVSFFLLNQGKTPVWSFSSKPMSIAGVAFDLSPFGARLVLPAYTRSLSDTFSVHLSDSKLEPVTLIASPIWYRQASSKHHTETGCSFRHTDNQSRLLLMDYIRENQKKNINQRFIRCEVCVAN